LDSKFVDSHSDERHSLYSPVDETLICDQVQYATAEDVDAAVDAAVAAFNGSWRKFTGAQRGEALLKLAALMLKHREELAWLDAAPIGKTTPFSLREVELAAENLRCRIPTVCTSVGCWLTNSFVRLRWMGRQVCGRIVSC
jgi:acyl-CoA reductase-like NAD-dependent aldehyde dehydrogenase